MNQVKHKQLHHFGCYLLSLIQAANPSRNHVDFYNKFYEAGYIQRDCTVLDPIAIFNSIAEYKVHTLTIIRDYKGKKPPAMSFKDWFSGLTEQGSQQQQGGNKKRIKGYSHI